MEYIHIQKEYKWEMSKITRDNVFLWSQEEFTCLTHKSFIQFIEKEYDLRQKELGEYNQTTTMQLLLGDGWEPFAIDGWIEKTIYFRRGIKNESQTYTGL